MRSSERHDPDPALYGKCECGLAKSSERRIDRFGNRTRTADDERRTGARFRTHIGRACAIDMISRCPACDGFGPRVLRGSCVKFSACNIFSTPFGRECSRAQPFASVARLPARKHTATRPTFCKPCIGSLSKSRMSSSTVRAANAYAPLRRRGASRDRFAFPRCAIAVAEATNVRSSLARGPKTLTSADDDASYSR